MHWLYLVIAIIFEVGWAIAMKKSDGLSKLPWTLSFAVMYLLSAGFLALATKTLDVGLAYAMWAGVGMAIIATIGIVFLKEPAGALRIASLALVLIGVVGLKISATAPKPESTAPATQN
ncbi:MAG: multidrug efflux SMR transporter [Phycisphaeraceae bacterium]|nr:multidrug efflux SMR transporter [Phycisphaeraceae bacterium]